MANILKLESGDIGKDELIAYLKKVIIKNRAEKENEKNGYGWGGKNFNKKLKDFCESYDLMQDAFYLDHESERPNIIIRKDWKDFALALMLTYNRDPYLLSKFDLADKASVNKILDYHETIIELVENHFSEETKYSIMNTSHYQSMVDEHIAMKVAIKKMNELATAMSMSNSEVRGCIWKEIYLVADCLIYRLLETKNTLDEEKLRLAEEQTEKFRKIAFEHLGEAMFNGITKDNVEEKWQALTEQMESSMDYYNFLMEKSALDDDELLNRTCSNISQVLAAKLRELLQHSQEAKTLQIKNGEIYDALDVIAEKDIQSMQRAMEIFKKECSNEEINKKRIEAERKIIGRIENIKKSYQELETMEDMVKKKLQDTKKGNSGEVSPELLAFYEEFLEFAQMIKRKTEEKEKDKNSVFDAAILDGVYSFLEK